METVAIVGRPNVGKSTLFNRLTGQRTSIVDDQSGVTRDRVYGESEWGGIQFNLIDTGGFVPNSDDVFETAIREQVRIAMDEASVILFVVDVTTGITFLDDEIAMMLRKTDKKALLVVNKVDNHQRLLDSNEFYSLGFEQLLPLSSINGSGTGELMDSIIEDMEKIDENYVDDDIPKIAIIGQPNAGKSSIINVFLGEDRNVVTDIAGTTRDSIHTRFNKFNKDIILIDTAGIRKKSKVHENLEFYSVIRAIKALDEADVCVLMIDAFNGVTAQDITIFALAARKKRGIVIAVNKWDLVPNKTTNTVKDYEDMIRDRIAPFRDVPIVFISVTEKQRVLKVLDYALDVYENKKRKISTSKLNDHMLKVIERNQPPVVKGKSISIKFVTQLPSTTPSFAFFCSNPKYIRDAYKNFLENQIRIKYNFTGVPINIFFREK
ncbi:MAG: GTP-binding protein [Chitinophagales bacterium]|jgi:GTP-binding protein